LARVSKGSDEQLDRLQAEVDAIELACSQAVQFVLAENGVK
jgi:hypothetical protein